MRMAKRPAIIKRMLRAKDQLRDLGASGENDVDGVLMWDSSPKDVDTALGYGRRIAYESENRGLRLCSSLQQYDYGNMTMVGGCDENDGGG
jgi:hypothetical protein